MKNCVRYTAAKAPDMHGGGFNLKSDKDKVYDRLSADLPINAQVAPAVVDDPLEPGAKLRVLRSVRDDPAAGMHARGQIDACQLAAARRWQLYHERSEIGGARAIDTTREAVDGGRMPEVLGERQMAASAALRDADQRLGERDMSLIRDILGDRLSLSDAAQRRHLTGVRGINYIGRRFRDALDTLAKLWGLRT